MKPRALIVAVTAILVGSASGSTVPPDAPNQPPFPLSSLQARCDDQTGAGIIASVEPEYNFTLRPLGEFHLPPEIPLTIRVTYRGGALTCYPAIIPPPWSTRPEIAAQVGVVMEMQFVTTGGAFNEQFDTEIKGRAGGALNFEYSTTPDKLQGTYRPDLPNYSGVGVGFVGYFGADLTNGEVVEFGIPPGHVSELIPVAAWVTYFYQTPAPALTPMQTPTEPPFPPPTPTPFPTLNQCNPSTNDCPDGKQCLCCCGTWVCMPPYLPCCALPCSDQTPLPTPTPTIAATPIPTVKECNPLAPDCPSETTCECCCGRYECIPPDAVCCLIVCTLPTTPTPTPTQAALPCVGDCDHSGRTTVDEIVRMVNIALNGDISPSTCPGVDQWCNSGPVLGAVGITCLIDAVNNLLTGCPTSPPTPSPTPPTPTGAIRYLLTGGSSILFTAPTPGSAPISAPLSGTFTVFRSQHPPPNTFIGLTITHVDFRGGSQFVVTGGSPKPYGCAQEISLGCIDAVTFDPTHVYVSALVSINGDDLGLGGGEYLDGPSDLPTFRNLEMCGGPSFQSCDAIRSGRAADRQGREEAVS